MEILSRIESEMKSEFEKDNRILGFEEYLRQVEKFPRIHIRGSAQYLVDTFDHYGKDGERFKLFDVEFDDPRYKVIDQVEVQNDIYSALQGFVREGINNKLILLHGPNGAAKTSLINCILRGMEHYSRTPDGALYKFNWIFPVEKIVKGSLGLGTRTDKKAEIDTYAKLSEDEIAAKIPCELKDHPLLLLPSAARRDFFNKAFKSEKGIFLPEYLSKGELSHKSKQIFESLLISYKGDLRKVLMHVQVERFYISKRYRTGAVTIEPQMHVDASARQVTMDRSLALLPPSLQSINLYELSGDLVEGNRGIVEYADILKRPVDTFKYLLVACETNTISVGPSMATLDTVLMGSTNELQLDAFKEFPDFVSFKGRIELIRVPYLLRYSEEQKVYDLIINKISGSKHITPHTTFVAALWAVLTRLKKPNPSVYPSPANNLVAELTPLQKARFYDHGATPEQFSAEEKKHLKASLKRMREEYSNIPYYEGRMGASAREIKSILYDAAHNPEFKTLSPLAVFRELEDFIKRTSEYEFLREDPKEGYHAFGDMIETVRREYLTILDREVRESMGLIQVSQLEEFIKKYVLNLSHFLKKEKIKNPVTGKSEDPDMAILDEFEKIVDAPTGQAERETFRAGVISNIGAYALDNPKKPVEYKQVFPDFMKKLENFYFDQQKSQMKKLSDAISLFGTDKEDSTSEHHKLAKTTVQAMVARFGYSIDCATQAIQYLIKTKY